MVLLHAEDRSFLDTNRNQLCSSDPAKNKMKQFILRTNTLRNEDILENRPDYFSKVVLLGDPCTGKTTLLNYLLSDTSSIDRKNSGSCIPKFRHVAEKIFKVSEKLLLTRIYDTAGMNI